MNTDPVTHRGPRAAVVTALIIVALVISIIASAGTGAFAIPPRDVLGSIGKALGVGGQGVPELAHDVLWRIRFPRVTLSVLVGGSLGCAGAAMQGTFANPLAEPGIIGVSAGASLGAIAAIVVGLTTFGVWALPIAAFIGGLVTVVAVYLSARADGRTEVVTLVLTGVAVNALVGALIGLATFFSDDAELRSITFWTLGSMAQATWPKVLAVLPLAIIGATAATALGDQLDLLSLGEREARHLGVDVERLRVLMLTIVAVLSAAAVAVSGTILFVGLVVPHLVRMMVGPRHRLLLILSALLGSLVVVSGDLIARTIASPRELPLGVLTSLVGAPFFFWQLRRTRSAQGGWA